MLSGLEKLLADVLERAPHQLGVLTREPPHGAPQPRILDHYLDRGAGHGYISPDDGAGRDAAPNTGAR